VGPFGLRGISIDAKAGLWTGNAGHSHHGTLPSAERVHGRHSPHAILADIFSVHAYRAHAKGILVLKMIPPALVGIICGWLLMPHIPTQAFGRFIGWLTLALVLLVLAQKFAPRWTNFAVEHPGIAWPFGWLAGSTTMLANAAGPVMTVYLLACRLPKFEFGRHGGMVLLRY
jgi:uncharacterized membrane protein YfcA